MRFEAFSFGSISIDGTTYGYDVVIDRGASARRNIGLRPLEANDLQEARLRESTPRDKMVRMNSRRDHQAQTY